MIGSKLLGFYFNLCL